MRKSTFIDPERNEHYASAAIAASVFVFAYSIVFGFLSILVFYALWLPLVFLDYRRVLGNYTRFYWIFSFVILAILSFAWSAAPSVTIRAGIQYGTTIICALIASRTVSTSSFMRGMTIGVATVLLYSLAFGEFQYDELDGTYDFVGAFSSKNQLGFFASLGVYFAFGSFFIMRASRKWRIISLIGGTLAVYCLLYSSSATSIIATAATIVISLTLGFSLLFPPRYRKVFFSVLLIVAIAGAGIALNSGVLDVILGAFGKDTTLTGRTYLWQEGLRAFQTSPLLGIGYQAYWVQGFSEAERLWDEFYIANRSGFHFHNTYIEVLVELGYVGLVLIGTILAVVVFGNLRRLLIYPRAHSAHLLFGVSILLLIRSFFEIDFMQPYTIGSFLLYYLAGQIAIKRHADNPVYSTTFPYHRELPYPQL
ncbi:O-antigen ligase [Phyllobacterium sp. SB3]|uniref:O-antigen ligase family protein n=1 Tax=Phyllobacterium sp. SB3 TaxID=3156073 RepID=UPI0032AF4ECA